MPFRAVVAVVTTNSIRREIISDFPSAPKSAQAVDPHVHGELLITQPTGARIACAWRIANHAARAGRIALDNLRAGTVEDWRGGPQSHF